MQRATLRVLKLIGQHGVDRASLDRGLDHRGRVDPNDRLAMKQRVEVVLTIGFVDRVRPWIDLDVGIFVRSVSRQWNAL